MSRLLLKGLSKHFSGTVAVEGVDLEVAEGELVALLGPSGCGKTTTLRMVAGFLPPTAGQIHIGESDVTRLPPHKRDTGMVFQSYALFPHMTVAQNVSFGLEMRKVPPQEREARIAEALKMVRLDHLVARFPRELSGGQQQRVALARALAINPAVFLLDEPLSNLDAKLRGEVRLEIRSLQQRLGLTTLIVTHDQEEALTMADRLVVMDRGRVQQVGTPEDLYERPANVFVASFVGRCNLFKGRVASAGRFVTADGVELLCNSAHAAASQGVLALRPERVAIAKAASGGIAARLEGVTYLGAQTEYRLTIGALELLAAAPTPLQGHPQFGLRAGDAVQVSWAPEDARILPPEQ